jgi:two-component system, NtrC family, response regulator AtoC
MTNSVKIFIVEDDEWFGQLLEYTLKLNPDYEVTLFSNAKDCLAKLNEKPHLITVDYRLPDLDGTSLIKEIKKYDSDIEVLAISGQEDIETAVELLKAGAYDYIVKSKDIRDRLMTTVSNVLKSIDLKERVVSLQKELGQKFDFRKTIIGDSPAIKKVFEYIDKAIKTNITVTISGETGTGKELVAKAIHYHSDRKKGNFVAVNVSAIPSELIESELFGHEKGAFTGAANTRKGKFEEANGGTLFLDEIGEMEASMQAKILRVLQEREFVRVGSNKTIKTDCRLIVATHRNLFDEVKSGKFREDLYYRIYGLPIELPPLRERNSDILILSKHFLNEFCKENKMPVKKLSVDARKKLLNYPYPGNIRELKAIIDLAAVMANHDTITDEDIQFNSRDAMSNILGEELTLKEYTMKIIRYYLKKYDDNIKLVAQKLDIGQSTIYRLLKEEKEETGNLENS